MIAVVSGYALLMLFIWLVERVRVRRDGPDLFTLFVFLLVLQMILPGLYITSVIAFSSEIPETGVPFFNNVLADVGVYETSLTLILLYLFILTTYSTWAVVHSKVNLLRVNVPIISVRISMWRWLLIMLLGLFSSWALLSLLGGYDKLILFRNEWNGPDRTFITANLFSLTMTFMTLSIVGVMLFWKEKISMKFLVALLLVVGLSLMTVSRRALGVAIILSVFALVLENKRSYVKEMFFFSLIFMPIIVFGKRVLYLMGQGMAVTSSALTVGHGESFSGLMLFMVNVGTTTIESWATLLYLDMPMRFGSDHLLSIARRIPDGMLGLNIDFPERIVRLSTEVFLSADRSDVPPGLVGQMWLDYGFLGPVVWAVFFVAVIAALQKIYNSVEKDRAVILLFVIVLWIVCLPINTGSLDFVFSVDIIFLILFIAFIIKVKRVRACC